MVSITQNNPQGVNIILNNDNTRLLSFRMTMSLPPTKAQLHHSKHLCGANTTEEHGRERKQIGKTHQRGQMIFIVINFWLSLCHGFVVPRAAQTHAHTMLGTVQYQRNCKMRQIKAYTLLKMQITQCFFMQTSSLLYPHSSFCLVKCPPPSPCCPVPGHV